MLCGKYQTPFAGRNTETSAFPSPYNFAVVHAAISEKDIAFQLPEKRARTKSVDLLSIRIDPLLDTLRDDARFSALEEKLSFPKNN